MEKKFIIPFLICISILIVSEYYFLQELYGVKRTSIIIFTACGIILSIASFWLFYKKFSKAAK